MTAFLDRVRGALAVLSGQRVAVKPTTPTAKTDVRLTDLRSQIDEATRLGGLPDGFLRDAGPLELSVVGTAAAHERVYRDACWDYLERGEWPVAS